MPACSAAGRRRARPLAASGLREVRSTTLLDLFSGHAGVAAAARSMGRNACGLDLRRGPDQDVCSVENRKRIRYLMKAGLVSGIALAPPCSSFSMARNRYPVRSQLKPWGLDELSSTDRWKVRTGNRCLRTCLQIVKWSALFGIPVCLEIPQTSYMWSVPPLRKLIQQACVLDIHQCYFGSRWRKATRLAFWNPTGEVRWSAQNISSYRCHGKHGFCSHSGKKHVILQGSLTTRAASYPPRLARFIANNLESG